MRQPTHSCPTHPHLPPGVASDSEEQLGEEERQESGVLAGEGEDDGEMSSASDDVRPRRCLMLLGGGPGWAGWRLHGLRCFLTCWCALLNELGLRWAAVKPTTTHPPPTRSTAPSPAGVLRMRVGQHWRAQPRRLGRPHRLLHRAAAGAQARGGGRGSGSRRGSGRRGRRGRRRRPGGRAPYAALWQQDVAAGARVGGQQPGAHAAGQRSCAAGGG